MNTDTEFQKTSKKQSSGIVFLQSKVMQKHKTFWVRYIKEGKGVPQDYALAHMWFNLSGSNGYKDAVKNREIIEKRMSPSQIEEAQRLARNWKPKK